MVQIGCFAFEPRGFFATGVWRSVCAALNQIVHMVAKLGFDDVGILDATVFNGIVKQGGDGLVFGGAKLEGDGSYCHRVGDVGNGGAFANLTLVSLDAQIKRRW